MNKIDDDLQKLYLAARLKAVRQKEQRFNQSCSGWSKRIVSALMLFSPFLHCAKEPTYAYTPSVDKAAVTGITEIWSEEDIKAKQLAITTPYKPVPIQIFKSPYSKLKPVVKEPSLKGLSKNQKLVAKRLMKRCNQLGLTNKAFQAGLLANAYHESAFNEAAIGDYGHSIGIFQLHTKIGAGRGFSKSYLKTAENNLDAIYHKERKLINGIHQRAKVHNDPRTVAREFCLQVERPANKHQMAALRAASVNKIV
jgi:hypothetical protein